LVLIWIIPFFLVVVFDNGVFEDPKKKGHLKRLEKLFDFLVGENGNSAHD